MILQSQHITRYLYSDPVSICHTEVHLAPRTFERQRLIHYSLEVQPAPAATLERLDYFGNRVQAFSLHEPHRNLKITARSTVEITGLDVPLLLLSPNWESVRDALSVRKATGTVEACEFTFDSPHVLTSPELVRYAQEIFAPGRPLLEGAEVLMHGIYKNFKYDPRATTISTPVAEVLTKKRGVCQDFAHFMIACLRSLGLAARYVSGYLKSGEKTIGAEASHAWVSVYCPMFGWVDFDPTNDTLPGGEHLTVAWGRDFADVTPVKGIALGGGEQLIDVGVQVIAL